MENKVSQPSNKFTKAHLLIILSVFALFALYGYYEIVLKAKINGATLIDNPTAKPISVIIDAKTYKIPANSYLKTDLEEGQHSLTCKEYGITNQELKLEPTIYGVINPTKAKYVIYNIIYTKKDLSSQFKKYEVEGREIYSLLGEPQLTTDLFIPDRTLGKGNIDTPEPSSENYNKMNQDYAFISKIFRLNDFFEFYDKNNK